MLQKIPDRAHNDNAESAFNEGALALTQNLRVAANKLKTEEVAFAQSKLPQNKHCMKIVRIRSFSGPDFPVFRLNTEIYFVNLQIRENSRKNPNTDTFCVVIMSVLNTGLGSFK